MTMLRTLAPVAAIALTASLAVIAPAQAQHAQAGYHLAQYYPPPPGYYAPPPPPPGYYAPPRRYERPEYPEYGRHCEAFLRTQYGPQRLFCRIIEAKPLGMECACPPPPPPPGYAPGPYVGGRTVP